MEFCGSYTLRLTAAVFQDDERCPGEDSKRKTHPRKSTDSPAHTVAESATKSFRWGRTMARTFQWSLCWNHGGYQVAVPSSFRESFRRLLGVSSLLGSICRFPVQEDLSEGSFLVTE